MAALSFRVTTAFGPFVVNQLINDPAQAALILAGPYGGYLEEVLVTSPTTTSGSSGVGVTSSNLTLPQVDAEIAAVLASRGLPAGATVPGLIAAALAAQGVRTAQLMTALQIAPNLGGWAGFAAWASALGALGVDPSSPLWIATQRDPFASPTGVFGTAIGNYLRTPVAAGGLGLSAAIASTQLAALFAAAAQVPN